MLKKIILFAFLPILLVGCKTELDSTPEEKIENLIFIALKSDECTIRCRYAIDKQKLTKKSITLHKQFDKNTAFQIVNFLIDHEGICSETPIWNTTMPDGYFVYYFDNNKYMLKTTCVYEPILYNNERIYTLTEAFENKIISNEYLIEHSFADEYYGEPIRVFSFKPVFIINN